MVFTLAALVLLASGPGSQPARDARVSVTVVDATAAVIPGATVTLTALDAPARPASGVRATTNDKGIALLEELAEGRYRIAGGVPRCAERAGRGRGSARHLLRDDPHARGDRGTLRRSRRDAAAAAGPRRR